jgi:hypothetical protein
MAVARNSPAADNTVHIEQLQGLAVQQEPKPPPHSKPSNEPFQLRTSDKTEQC